MVRKRQIPATLIATIVLFIVLKIILALRFHDIRWDEAVYLTMGDYLLSGGSIGYWEALRPPILPIILAILAWVGNPVILGEILVNAIAIAGSVGMYYLLRAYVDKKLSTIGAATLLLLPVWYWHSSMLLTGVISGALIIFHFLLLRRKQYLWAGVIISVAALTRYPAGIVLIATTITLAAINVKEKTKQKDVIAYLAGASILLIPWMIINTIVFSKQGLLAPIYPLLRGAGNVFIDNVWMRNTYVTFYFKQLIINLPLAVLALAGIKRATQEKELQPMIASLVLMLIFFSVLEHRLWRFALIFVALIIVLMILGVNTLSQKYGKKILHLILLLLVIQLCFFAIIDAKLVHQRTYHTTPPAQFYHNLSAPQQGVLLTADPVAAYYLKMPAKPIYYEMMQDDIMRDASMVIIVEQHLVCAPNDTICEERKEQIIKTTKEEFELVAQTSWQGYDYQAHIR